jgi:hypothetical protein
MQFAPFICLLVFDSTLERKPDAATDHKDATVAKAAKASVRKYSVTHFDSAMEPTKLLSVNRIRVPKPGIAK